MGTLSCRGESLAMRRMNKRGVFYTAISLLIVSILLLTFRPKPGEVQTEILEVEQKRLEIANDLVENINNAFIPRLVTVSAYRALQAMILYMNYSGTYDADELNGQFTEVLMTGNLTDNGTTENLDDFLGSKIMGNYTLLRNLRMLEQSVANNLNLNLEFNETSYFGKLYQSKESGERYVLVNLTLHYFLNAFIAQWNITKTWKVQVPIIGLPDPLLMEKTHNKIDINFADYEINYSKDWTSLFRFIDDIDFLKEENAPNFVMRMTGDYLNSECCGYESAINPNFFNFSNEYNLTYIDWCFYSTRCAPYIPNSSLYEITNITSHSKNVKFYGFKLDAYHYAKFDCSN